MMSGKRTSGFYEWCVVHAEFVLGVFWTRTWFLWSGNVLSVIHESSGRSLVLISAAIGNCSWIAHYVVNKLKSGKQDA
jgi:hypothetical protein